MPTYDELSQAIDKSRKGNTLYQLPSFKKTILLYHRNSYINMRNMFACINTSKWKKLLYGFIYWSLFNLLQ